MSQIDGSQINKQSPYEYIHKRTRIKRELTDEEKKKIKEVADTIIQWLTDDVFRKAYNRQHHIGENHRE